MKTYYAVCSSYCDNGKITANLVDSIDAKEKPEDTCTETKRSYIDMNHKRINIGTFNDKNDAIIARLKAEKEYFGEFAPQQHLFEEYGI